MLKVLHVLLLCTFEREFHDLIGFSAQKETKFWLNKVTTILFSFDKAKLI